jgi:TatA/E family protein of Tat protein translocase
MDLFGMGPLEILLILVVALLVFGPERLPEIGRTIGKTVRAFRKTAFDLTAQMTKEIEGEKEQQPGKTGQTDDTPDRSAQS